MIITEKNRYLVIPTKRTAEQTRIYFYHDGKLVRDLFACIDFEAPDYIAYYDMKSFMDMDIHIECESGSLETSDHVEYGEDDAIRPEFHFTAKRGWINDPNGLIFYEGKYHAFFQHNPIGAMRGTEHWGHSVSDDLIHWEEWDIALFPDEFGTMFSGCAVIDKDNLLGLNTDEHQALVLFYTASGGKRSVTAEGMPYVQCMAVSTDGGRTFQKYEKNPIIGPHREESRDPMVVYDEQNKMFVMVFYLEACDFAFYKSYNLTDWTHLCDFTLEGDQVCPDLYPLRDGDRIRWVFSAGRNFYVTADMDSEKGLVNVSEIKRFGYGPMYAAQSFKIDGKVLRITWIRTMLAPIVKWDNTDIIPTRKHSQLWSTPVEIGICDGTLLVKPHFEFKKQYKAENVRANARIELPKKPLDLYIKPSADTEKLSFELFGNTVEIDGKVLKFTTYYGENYEMPYEGEIRILADTFGYDIFSSDKCYAAYCAVSDFEKNYLKITGEGTLEVLEWGTFDA